MKKANDVIQIYRKYYVDRDYEQLDLFQLLKDEFKIQKVVYPGSFVHISPSFIFPDVTYIDSDKQAKIFFKNNEQVKAFIHTRKQYQQETSITFLGEDYRTIFKEFVDCFDLLVSQYAGFISEACKAYLKIDGILLVNNSHGDAGLAAIDKDFKLIATVHKSREKYHISYADLNAYFSPKGSVKITKNYLHKLGKGVDYTKTAFLYIFRRVA